MSLDTPTLLVGILVSAVGFVLFRYGKAQERLPHLLVGLAVMIFPYFTGGWVLTLVIGAALMVGLWLVVRAGM